ncbi:Leucine rich repeat N-terminal domain [Musa troglodytarum]|nr:Leucine rich repeat N-terminal domain [Musa troglodytarum]
MVLVPVSVSFAGSRQLEFNYKLHSQVGIDLSNNALRGEIPEGLIGLKGLEYLNLSYNDLAGRIPGNLEKMGKLKRLDLSHNSLSGEVPASISGLRELEALNLSYNCLSGPVPTREGLQRFPGALAGNPALCMEFSGKGCDTEASLPAGKAIGTSGGGDDGWMSVGAFWISAVASFYASVVALLCSPMSREYIFQAFKPEF